jgi:MFS family permease
MGSEGDITPYLLGRYFGLKRFSTLYALTWTTYAIGAAAGPVLVGRVFDMLGSYRPITIQLLALPALIPCLLMFALPRYGARGGSTQSISVIHEPQPAEISH